MVVAWFSPQIVFFPMNPNYESWACLAAHTKTVAMGFPLINAIYEGDPSGLYTLLLDLAPIAIGDWETFNSCKLLRLVKRGNDQGIVEDENGKRGGQGHYRRTKCRC
jgi:hypothetical protein